MLKRELAEKYRNAVPADMSESTFGKYCQEGFLCGLLLFHVTPLE